MPLTARLPLRTRVLRSARLRLTQLAPLMLASMAALTGTLPLTVRPILALMLNQPLRPLLLPPVRAAAPVI